MKHGNDDKPEIHQVTADDSAGLTDSAFVDGSGPSGAEYIRVARGGPDPRIAGADLAPPGTVGNRVEGRASPKDDRELRTASGLVERLNLDGAGWYDLHRAVGREEGVDCEARNPVGDLLRIQVTFADQDIWSGLIRQDDAVERSDTVDIVVNRIRNAIEKKRTRYDPRIKLGITLALDATDSPAPALRSVVQAFRSAHGQWAAEAGFAEIWIVGPVVDLVHRLDAPT